MGNTKTIVTRRGSIRWMTMASRKRRSHLIEGKRRIERRNIRGSIWSMRATRIMEGKEDSGEVGRGSKEEGEELDGKEGGSGEGGASAQMGHGGGSIGTEHGVSGNKRKEMSSAKKAEEEGCG
jgi:hypothetical protein